MRPLSSRYLNKWFYQRFDISPIDSGWVQRECQAQTDWTTRWAFFESKGRKMKRCRSFARNQAPCAANLQFCNTVVAGRILFLRPSSLIVIHNLSGLPAREAECLRTSEDHHSFEAREAYFQSLRGTWARSRRDLPKTRHRGASRPCSDLLQIPSGNRTLRKSASILLWNSRMISAPLPATESF